MRKSGWVRALLLGALLAGGVGAATAQQSVVQGLVRLVVASSDNAGQPFAIVDKRGATLNVYTADGHLVATTPALLGIAPGDVSAPGVAQRVQTGLAVDDRTTPAGRFVSEPGRNLKGEHVVWVDYGSAFAIHRMRPSAARERREERLASATPDDNRISLGCVVVSVQFYEQVVYPMLGQRKALVYVLPESGSIAEMFALTAH
jgi:hypothetical protein